MKYTSIKRYCENNIITLGGKDKFEKELCETIKELSEYPSENLEQIIFFCKALKFIKSN